jgi:hypothetical protein
MMGKISTIQVDPDAVLSFRSDALQNAADLPADPAPVVRDDSHRL